ncbi:class II aldolase/adducin family protein [Kibdelosporangium philippinense]|uniref:Class II aldolase/adducin family protein n=1 Tax=Kibdelosporangium philippinense TaxID=211113 RepID=A0ABS8Z3D0_9PSEU|nr:class II aldolase/adducin family protein [Kibdelosporangium philippinense]MCE7002310.1 class II aldolase/adducin family protein [Kibdelosporangium philippinense]
MTTAVDPTFIGLTLAELVEDLDSRGWLRMPAGHLSVRMPGQAGALITTGRRDVLPIRVADGKPVSPNVPDAAPCAALHAALYRTQPDCQAVVMASPPHVGAVSARATSAVRFDTGGIPEALGATATSTVDVPVFPGPPDFELIAIQLEARRRLPGPAVLMIGGQSAVAWGPTLESARHRLVCLEALCHLKALLDWAAVHP